MDSDEQGSCREGREPERNLLELRLVDPPHRGDTGECPQPEGWHEQRVDEQARRGDEAESGAERKSGQATRRRRPLRCTPTWSLSATSRCCATVTGLEQLAVLAAGLGAGSLTSTVGVASLLSFPVLVAVGLPPVVANASNTVGMTPAGMSGSFGYRAELRAHPAVTVLVLLTYARARSPERCSCLRFLPSRSRQSFPG